MRLLVAMAALLIPFLSSCEKNEPPMPLPLPEFDRAVFETLSSRMATSEIDVNQCKRLRRVFRGVSVDKRPPKWQTYGYLSLYNGQTLIVRFMLFWDPDSIGAFKYDGNYYRGYDQELFRALNWQRIPENLSKQIETLNQSEKSHSFSATIPFSESYNLPRK